MESFDPNLAYFRDYFCIACHLLDFFAEVFDASCDISDLGVVLCSIVSVASIDWQVI